MAIEAIERNETDNIGFKQLLQLREKYWMLLEKFPFPKPPVNNSTFEMLSYFKRKSVDYYGTFKHYFTTVVVIAMMAIKLSGYFDY